ncbi:MAG TPA: thioredoxin domain-containing protein, partial [Pyrinomonadaceae bacterium]|nr:thioredoxin domain-containing protein [Pyrinomonadaceae bacterium]
MKFRQILILTVFSFIAATSPSAAVTAAPTQTPPPAAQSEIECGCEDNPSLDLLAIVNGVKIRQVDLSVDTRSKIRLLQDTVIEARSHELDRVIASNLLEAAAKSRGLTARKLLQIEVTGKVVPPTDAEAQEFYKRNLQRMVKDYKDAKAGILATLKSEREVQEAQKFATALRAAADVKILVDKITPPANAEQRLRVIATVNGRPITSGDIEDSLAPLIFQVKTQTYAYRKAELDLKINDLLLEQEAKKQGVAPLALVSREISGKLQMITDQQVLAFYKENKSQFNQEFSKVQLQIVKYLLEQQQEQLANAYADQLRSRAVVQVFLKPPQPPSYRISVANQPSRGNDDATVTVFEFIDFENPRCAVQFRILEQLIADFGTQVRFVVRDFPEPTHKSSVKAAEAAEAAYQQGKYWEY